MVICDRFADSTRVYQGYALKLGLDKVEPTIRLGCLGIVPDLTFFLDVEPKKALSRIKRKKDRIERRPLRFHQDLRKGYRILARRQPRRIKIIGNNDMGRTRNEIRTIVKRYV